MKKKALAALLKEAQSDRDLVRVYSKAAPSEKYYGFVVGVSDEFVLLHHVDTEFVAFNGYLVYPLKAIRWVRVLDGDSALLSRALRLKGLTAQPLQNIDMDNGMPGLLVSIDMHYPLTTLNVERKYPNTCFIGRVAKLDDKSVTLREIDTDAQWKRSRVYRYKDITRVDFGGGYEEALWLVSDDERQRTGRSIESSSKKKS